MIIKRGDITILGHAETQVAFKIVQHILSVSQKLMEQQYMMLKT